MNYCVASPNVGTFRATLQTSARMTPNCENGTAACTSFRCQKSSELVNFIPVAPLPPVSLRTPSWPSLWYAPNEPFLHLAHPYPHQLHSRHYSAAHCCLKARVPVLLLLCLVCICKWKIQNAPKWSDLQKSMQVDNFVIMP